MATRERKEPREPIVKIISHSLLFCSSIGKKYSYMFIIFIFLRKCILWLSYTVINIKCKNRVERFVCICYIRVAGAKSCITLMHAVQLHGCDIKENDLCLLNYFIYNYLWIAIFILIILIFMLILLSYTT